MISEKISVRPATQKQISYAKFLSQKTGLKINKDVFSSSIKCSQFINEAKSLLEARKKMETENPADEFETDMEEDNLICNRPVEYSNIEADIICFIPVDYIRQNKKLYKKKKLWNELIKFFKFSKAKMSKCRKFLMISSSIFYPSHVLRTILDSFFLKYEWQYKTLIGGDLNE